MQENWPKPNSEPINEPKKMNDLELIPKAEGIYKDWRTNWGLAKDLGVGQGTVQKIADKSLKSNPGYFKDLRDRCGRVKEHYSPEFIEIINAEINEIPKAEGIYKDWRTNLGIATELEATKQSTQKIADKYLKSNPEYFKNLRDRIGQVREHYSPELIEIIRNNTKSMEEAPQNWVPKDSLEQKLRDMGLLENEIKNIIEKNRIKSPGETGRFKSGE